MARVVRIEGLKELQQALKQLPKATQGAVLRRALMHAAEPMRAAAEANAPVDVGVLAQSVDASPKLTRRQRSKAGKSAVRQADGSYRSARSTGAELYIGPGAGARAKAPPPSGLMQEFGTRHHAAKPWLRPAWDAHRQGALDTIADELGVEIEKAARRLAAKQARAAAKLTRR